MAFHVKRGWSFRARSALTGRACTALARPDLGFDETGGRRAPRLGGASNRFPEWVSRTRGRSGRDPTAALRRGAGRTTRGRSASRDRAGGHGSARPVGGDAMFHVKRWHSRAFRRGPGEARRSQSLAAARSRSGHERFAAQNSARIAVGWDGPTLSVVGRRPTTRPARGYLLFSRSQGGIRCIICSGRAATPHRQ